VQLVSAWEGRLAFARRSVRIWRPFALYLARPWLVVDRLFRLRMSPPTQIQDLWVCLHGRSPLRGVTSRGQLGVANCSPPAPTPLKRASVPATDQTWRRTASDCGRSCEVVPAARPHRASEIGALQPIAANRNALPWLPFSRASRTAISTACVPCSTRAGFARG